MLIYSNNSTEYFMDAKCKFLNLNTGGCDIRIFWDTLNRQGGTVLSTSEKRHSPLTIEDAMVGNTST